MKFCGITMYCSWVLIRLCLYPAVVTFGNAKIELSMFCIHSGQVAIQTCNQMNTMDLCIILVNCQHLVEDIHFHLVAFPDCSLDQPYPW